MAFALSFTRSTVVLSEVVQVDCVYLINQMTSSDKYYSSQHSQHLRPAFLARNELRVFNRLPAVRTPLSKEHTGPFSGAMPERGRIKVDENKVPQRVSRHSENLS